MLFGADVLDVDNPQMFKPVLICKETRRQTENQHKERVTIRRDGRRKRKRRGDN